MLEKVLDGTGVTRFRYYLYSQSNTAAIAVMSRNSDGSNGTYYVLDDHQQSPAAIRDANGTAVVNENFSAYGVRRNWQTWQGAAETVELTTSATITRQGYTWQTALGNMGLNHMNGRVQDAITGIFLSADPYISEPTNTQNYNRYSYVYNNPLSLTDPSGFWACEWNMGFTFAGTTGSGIFGGNNIEQTNSGGVLDLGAYDRSGKKLGDYNASTGMLTWSYSTYGYSWDMQSDGTWRLLEELTAVHGTSYIGTPSTINPTTASNGLASSGTTITSKPQTQKPDTCVNYTQLVTGAVSTVGGGLQVLEGVASALMGAALIPVPVADFSSPVLIGSGALNMAWGSASVRDGWGMMQSAFDGVQRQSTFGQIGQSLAGDTGGKIGDVLTIAAGSIALSKSAAQAVNQVGTRAGKAAFLDSLANAVGQISDGLTPCRN